MDREVETKRLCSREDACASGGGGGRGRGGSGWWEGLSPEILALIFVRIQADELVRAVPFVCKSWRDAVAGPYCWADIDVEQWCRRCNRSDRIDSAVRRLVRRSRGTLRRLSAYKLSDSGFSFVANCGRFLKVLRIPMSDVTDKMVAKHAESLAMVTVLDISYCLKITCQGLEALGKHCKSLVHLRRNMPPPEWEQTRETKPKVDDGEAMVIAGTMPGLRRLELGYGRFSDNGLNAILTNCRALTYLDIQGCWSVNLGGDLEDKCGRLVVFKSPWDDEYDDAHSSDDDADADADVTDYTAESSSSDSESS